jgi:glutamate synthase (NADPH/NADH) small chain
MNMKEAPGTDFTQKVDLMLLAMGFVHVVHKGMVEQFGLKLDERGNIVVNDYQTSVKGIFSAGDASLGASLVVRAINAGREAAAAIDNFLRA